MSIKNIFLVGPTGSGKTDLALSIAQQHHGEIICADSRTVYRGLDVGTAKPTAEEQARICHWGLDLITPDRSYSAHQFKLMAQQACEDIHSRGKVAIIAGGTGLYIDTMLYDLQLGLPADPAQRAALEELNVGELQALIKQKQLQMPRNLLNKRHLVRVLELNGHTPDRKTTIKPETIVVGISTSKEVLIGRLTYRAQLMFDNPQLYAETEVAMQSFGANSPGLSGNIYRLVIEILEGKISKYEAIQRFITLDWRLAKRQLTWFRRNPDIVWLEKEQIVDYVNSKIS